MVPMVLAVVACSETGLNRDPGADGFVPILEIEPMIVEFGAAAEGEEIVRTLTATNVGDETLRIDGQSLEGPAAFRMLGELPDTLVPGESVTVDAAFSPVSQMSAADFVVTSDAPATPEVRVSLRGAGLYPALRIVPWPIDLGSVAPGCETDEPVELVNAGTAPLSITSAVIVGEGFAWAPEVTLPVTVAPGEGVGGVVSFTDESSGSKAATLYVASDDPAGVTVAPASVTVETAPDEANDHLVQGGGPWERVDVLVYVDQSGSMVDDQARLASNFATFVYNLEGALADWQAIVVTQDDGCGNQGIISPYDADASALFAAAVRGGGGVHTEAGLTLTERALQESTGGCNAGFLRDESKVLALEVSDEPEQSRQGWETKTPAIVALAPTISIAAIVGPTPKGCSTADAGYGYVEAATMTGGDHFSICEADWTDYFVSTVDLLEPPSDRLELSWPPVPESLAVSLDGDKWEKWRWDPETNAVIFDEIPSAGQRVEADYDVDHSVCL